MYNKIIKDLIQNHNISNPRILELGCGDGSTLFLHKLAKDHKGSITSLETNKEWYDKVYKKVKSEVGLSRTRKIELTKAFTKITYTDKALDQDWDIVLVDNAPGETRSFIISKLAKKNIPFIVVDDTNEVYEQSASDYRYANAFKAYMYKKVFKSDNQPYVTVLSNLIKEI